MNFKDYFKLRQKDFIFISVVMFTFFVVMFYMSYKVVGSAFYGNPIAVLIMLLIWNAMITVAVILNYHEHKKLHIRLQQRVVEEKEWYKNLSFKSLVDMVYDNELLDLDMTGCPEWLSGEQEREWLSKYITELRKNNNEID